MSDLLSPHFSLTEAACRATGEPLPALLRPQAELLATGVLEPLRARWMAPLVVVSWYRSPAYNAHLFALSQERARKAGREHGGVAQDSVHMTGGAADVRPVSLDGIRAFRDLVLAMYEHGELADLGGLGEYPGWCHLDVKRVGGRLRRWGGLAFGDEPR